MKNTRIPFDEERFHRLLMGAVDKELDSEEEKEFFLLVEQNPECRKAWDECRTLKEVTRAVKFKTMNDETWDRYWVRVYNRLERKAGWILFSIGSAVLISYGLYMAILSVWGDRTLPAVIKGGLLVLIGGGALLLVSVIREKWFLHRKDPYKEVER